MLFQIRFVGCVILNKFQPYRTLFVVTAGLRNPRPQGGWKERPHHPTHSPGGQVEVQLGWHVSAPVKKITRLET